MIKAGRVGITQQAQQLQTFALAVLQVAQQVHLLARQQRGVVINLTNAFYTSSLLFKNNVE